MNLEKKIDWSIPTAATLQIMVSNFNPLSKGRDNRQIGVKVPAIIKKIPL
jgi:hypothetical protein